METPTKIQEILEQQKQKQTSADPSNEANSGEFRFYDIWKGANQELNERYLDLRFRDGQRTGFDYPDRKFVNYNPEMPCIDIDFAGNLVTVVGRGLDELYELFLQRKVQWIKEADNPKNDEGQGGLFIEEILITPADSPASNDNEESS